MAYPDQVHITIDVTSRFLTLSLRRATHGVYPVAVGKPSTPTPVGKWSIGHKVIHPNWHVLGTRWMGLNIPWANYGIHGTNAPWSIGRYISNGCIRMHNHDIEAIFPLVPVGTPVSIVSSYGHWQGPTGPTRDEVWLLQVRLRDLGHDPGPVDGISGPRTQGALMAFQRQAGLPATGTLDQETRAALGL
jgi:hypothetical protein